MSDFPRGWTQTQSATASTASITIAAAAGVVHVLDSFFAKVMDATAVAAPFSVTLTSSDGVFAGLVLGNLYIPNTNSSDSASGSSLDLAAGPGASLTIAFNTSTAGTVEMLMVQGHDI